MSIQVNMEYLLNNPFMVHNGVELLRDEDGSYFTRAQIEPVHHNPYGIAHGGLLYTMADIASGVTARQYGTNPVTLDSDFHFLSNVSTGTLTARAEVVRAGRTVAVVRARITNETGKILADGTFTFYYKG